MAKDDLFNAYRVQPGRVGYFRLEATTNLHGQPAFVPVHVIRGRRPGPCLLMTATIHGNEHPPIRVMYQLRHVLDPGELAGTVVMVPVCNPVALARVRPALGEGPSLPRDVTLTERLTRLIAERVIPYADHRVDFHCHAEGCCLAEIICPTPQGDLDGASKAMAVAFGWGIIHEDDSSSATADGYTRTLGLPSFSPEIGGSGLGCRLESLFVRIQVRGTLNVLRHLRMYPGALQPYARQKFIYRRSPKVRPTVSGYLVSKLRPEDLFSDDVLAGRELGVRVREGDLLGEVFDPYSLERLEELRSPASGFVYLSRKDGVVQAGSLAYGIAADDGGRVV